MGSDFGLQFAQESYQGIALAMPQAAEIDRPFRGWNGIRRLLSQPIARLRPVSVDEFLCRHAPFAVQLNLNQIERHGLAASNQKTHPLHRNCARRQFARSLHGFSAVHLQILRLESGECPWPWPESAHAIE